MHHLRMLFELTRVRFYLFVREPEFLFWMLVFPILMAVVLGFAFRDSKLEPSRIAIHQELEGNPELARLTGSGDVELIYLPPETAQQQLRAGTVDLTITATAPFHLRSDETRPEAELARVRVLLALERTTRDAGVRVTETREQPRGSRYVDFLLPGLLAMNLMSTGIWGVAFGLVEHRKRKIIKRYLVTPMPRAFFLGSFILGRLVFLVVEVVALSSFAWFVLDVPLEGSLLTFGAFNLIAGLAFAGIGVLSAARAQTSEGLSGIVNFIMLPMWLASGVFFSYERFPEYLHPILRLLPLTAAADGLRAIMLDGAGWTTVGSPALILAAYGGLCLAIAVKVFRWQS